MRSRAINSRRLIMLALCSLWLVAMSGCASTGTILRVGLHYDVTDLVNGCDRKRESYCGLKGPRDIAVIELMYAPGLHLESTFVPYTSQLHVSHYSAGFPIDHRYEQVLDAPGVGSFIQFGAKK